MTDMLQFDLEVYSIFGTFDFYVDIFSGKIYNKKSNAQYEIISVQNNILYVKLFESNYIIALIHDYKFGCINFVNRRSMHYFKDVFVFPMEKYKTVYFEISKNACSAIAAEIYNHCTRKFYQPKITAKNKWDDVWCKPQYFKNLWVSKKEFIEQKDYYADWKKFVVYDNPLKRFLRAINDKINGHDKIASIIPSPQNCNYDDYISKMIIAAQMQTLNTTYFDQHLAPISLYVREFLDEITDFVPLENLNLFMKENFNITQQKIHEGAKEKKITLEMLSKAQILRLKEIYKEDFLLTKKYKDKFFKP